MKILARPKLIFFTKVAKPSDEEMAAVAVYNDRFKPVVRNAQHVKPDSTVENCQAVAGSVPPRYEHIPHADAYDPAKEPKVGSVRKDERGYDVVRELSPRDGTPTDRVLFGPVPPGSPVFAPPAQALKPWKPNA